MLLTSLFALQRAETGFNLRNTLALNVPLSFQLKPEQAAVFYKEAIRRIAELPGVEHVAVGTAVPWRDAGVFGPGFQFTVQGYAKANGEEDPRARFRTVSPKFFASLGVPIISGRDFSEADRRDAEPVVIVSQSVAQRMFPNQDAVNRQFKWTDPVMKFIGVSTAPRRIVGVAADVDDENVVPGPAMTVYHPFEQEIGGGRLFVHARSEPYALVPPITKIIRDALGQPTGGAGRDARRCSGRSAGARSAERARVRRFCRRRADHRHRRGGWRARVSVSARTREFGIRLAIGSEPRHLLTRVLKEGAVIAVAGIAGGTVAGLALAKLAASYLPEMRLPGALPLVSPLHCLSPPRSSPRCCPPRARPGWMSSGRYGRRSGVEETIRRASLIVIRDELWDESRHLGRRSGHHCRPRNPIRSRSMANPFVHVELNTTESRKPRRSTANSSLGSSRTCRWGPGMVYTLIQPGDGTGGGMMQQPVPGIPSAWLAYALVDDVKPATAKAKSLGAQVVQDVEEVPGMGWFSIIVDPTGAALGLWQAAKGRTRGRARVHGDEVQDARTSYNGRLRARAPALFWVLFLARATLQHLHPSRGLLYCLWSATIGSTREARRAGK